MNTVIEIGLDTPISMLTPRQLFAMQEQWLETIIARTSNTSQPQKNEWYVNSMSELAKILGSSQSTLYKMKALGLLDDAISQHGRWMMIDVNKVIEIFRLSNKRKRKKRQS